MNSSGSPRAAHRNYAFSLIEVLVVIGIITVLIGILLPVLGRARQQARMTVCSSNLREVGIALILYGNQNRGWIYPVQVDETTGQRYGFGTNVPPHERWPMKTFRLSTAILPPAYNPASYNPAVYDPITYDATPYTPPVLLCPSDLDGLEAHTYILNNHLAERGIKAGSHNLNGWSSSEVIVAGEKVTLARDYYMEKTDFLRIVERFRHGRGVGSNYLFMDGHVAGLLPSEASKGIDPWDITK
jgi:prepilin-type processing-associated H-X9-DG protein/prepilin-type N-terminal cleavage/methylation domain-containing protein